SHRNQITVFQWETIAYVFCDLSHAPFSSGIHVAKKIDKLGMRSSDTAQIFFEDVRVPCKNLIGEEGNGFTYQMLQFQEERLWGVASGKSSFVLLQGHRDHSLGPENSFTYRKVFGRPVLHNQTVHFRLAELAAEVELLRSLLHRAVALYVEGNDVTKFASMAKLKAGRLTREVTDSCLQFWGGMGFTNEVLVSRLYRIGKKKKKLRAQISKGFVEKYKTI
uniref:Acyl-CoA dehydrogenase/oxidase C-terminal domain-containing protein n=1 Tax=Zonotrichia albicollis TaxID=44394 RepID=A0A8D2N4B4_ZONAL